MVVSSPAVSIRDLSFSQKHRVHQLRGINLRIAPSQVSCLLGPNGSGKTTLLRCLLGLLPITAGQIEVEGQPLLQLSARERARLVAYVPQSAATTFPFTTLEIAVMGRTPHLAPGRTPGPREWAVAEDALAQLGIEHLAGQSFSSLSGGQRALALLARALVQQSPVMVLDEPTAALDLGNATKVLDVAFRFAREGRTVIMTTHQPEHALWIADQVALMVDGELTATGHPREVLTEELLSTTYGTPICLGSATTTAGETIPTCLPSLQELTKIGRKSYV
ncbi:ABC transporter ATP-binding protein [Actinomyces sp. F1_1611]